MRKIFGEHALNFSLKRQSSSSRPSEARRHRGAFALALLATLPIACEPRVTAGGQPRAGGTHPGTCRPLPDAARPTLPGPVAAPWLRAGEAWLSIDVPVTALEAEFERHVPRMLAAEEDRPIGSPGLVTYRVTRDKPRLRAADGRLTATLPVEIDLSLCKPLGSLCIGYGSCTPAYDVKATWDLTLSSHHE